MSLRVLHVGAFRGNFGDDLSHVGFGSLLTALFGNYDVRRLEIRKAYQNYRRLDGWNFDDSFIKLANSFDVVFLGGGNLLDYSRKGSATGTTFDIDLSLLDELTTPLVIGSVGSIPSHAVPQKNLELMSALLVKMEDSAKIELTFRVDGSSQILSDEFGFDACVVLDNAFLAPTADRTTLWSGEREYAVLNIAHDQLLLNGRNNDDRQTLYREIRLLINGLVNDFDLDVVLAPHIYSDLFGIGDVIAGLDDFMLRTRVRVAPYLHGSESVHVLQQVYAHSRIVIGSRYHANVAGLALGRPTIAIAALERVRYLHSFFGQESAVVSDLGPGVGETLLRKVSEALSGNPSRNIVSEMVGEGVRRTVSTYRDVFARLGLDPSGTPD